MANQSRTILSAAPAIRNHGRNDEAKRKAFGAAVIARSDELGLTRTKLAAAMEMPYSSLAHIESGESWPSVPVYLKLCEVLKVGKPPLF